MRAQLAIALALALALVACDAPEAREDASGATSADMLDAHTSQADAQCLDSDCEPNTVCGADGVCALHNCERNGRPEYELCPDPDSHECARVEVDNGGSTSSGFLCRPVQPFP